MSLTAIPEAEWARGGLALIARLKPGASIAQARAEMRLLDQARITELAVRDPQWRQVLVDVKPARAGLSTPLHDQFGGPLFVLMLTVGVLLLLACANIGGLLLARGAARQSEMALARGGAARDGLARVARCRAIPDHATGDDRIPAARSGGRRARVRGRAGGRH